MSFPGMSLPAFDAMLCACMGSGAVSLSRNPSAESSTVISPSSSVISAFIPSQGFPDTSSDTILLYAHTGSAEIFSFMIPACSSDAVRVSSIRLLFSSESEKYSVLPSVRTSQQPGLPEHSPSQLRKYSSALLRTLRLNTRETSSAKAAERMPASFRVMTSPSFLAAPVWIRSARASRSRKLTGYLREDMSPPSSSMTITE